MSAPPTAPGDGATSCPDATADLILERVSDALSPRERWPHQLGSEALAKAVHLDASRRGASPAEILALEDDQLVRTARLLAAALDGTGGNLELPFGTRVSVGRPGSVEIQGRVYVGRRNAPGIHRIEAVPRDPDSPTIESLRLMVGSWASSSNARRLGLPTAGTMSDGRVRHVLEFPPLEEAGGAVLQYDADAVDAARFSAAPIRSLERFCKALIKDLQWVWKHRARIAERVAEVRLAAEAGIALAERYAQRAVPGRICVDGRSLGRVEGPTLRVEYLGHDDALRRGSLFEAVAAGDRVAGWSMMRGPLVHRRRCRWLDELRTLRADGWIDAAAAHVARNAPEGQAAVLARLGRHLETVVAPASAGRGHGTTLFWSDGVIRAEPGPDGGLERLWGVVDREQMLDRLRAEGAQPSLFDGLTREKRPGVPHDVDWASAPDPLPSLVNTATGAIWPAPGKRPA